MSRNDPLWKVIKHGLTGTCPRCYQGKIFEDGLSMTIKDKCSICGLKFHEHDAGDGPAVFVIFILGFTIIPIAILAFMFTHWPEWLHYIIWPLVLLSCILGLLKPLKSLILNLKYHFDAGDDLSK